MTEQPRVAKPGAPLNTASCDRVVTHTFRCTMDTGHDGQCNHPPRSDTGTPETPPRETTGTERELSFAEQLCRRLHPPHWEGREFGPCDTCRTYVLAVIESSWLAADRAAQRAEAWDEGYETGREDEESGIDKLDANPYWRGAQC